MTNAVTLLGTKGGPSLRKGSPSPSSSVLQIDSQTILIDCGIGATRALVEADISLSDLDAIIITHLHSDHLLDLGPLAGIFVAASCSLAILDSSIARESHLAASTRDSSPILRTSPGQ